MYAAIHHESTYTDVPKANEADLTTATTSQLPDSRSTNGGPRNFQQPRIGKRYWNASQGGLPASVPSPGYKGRHPRPRNESSPFAAKEKPAQVLRNETTTTTATSLTPTFTPYVSMLSIASSPDRSSPSSENNDQPANTALTETNKLLQTTASSKNINPFNKQHTAKQPKNTANNGNEDTNDLNKNDEPDALERRKRPNPFSPQQLKNPKKEKKCSAKDRPVKNKGKNKVDVSADCVIDLESNLDDDDVIILPAVEPPLICVDSSDDESAKAADHAFAEPATRTNDDRKSKTSGGSRCPSPTSSIQSADDFIVQQDRHNINFDANLSYDDVYSGSETVADTLRQSDRSAASVSNSLCPAAIDAAVFTAPKTATTTNKGRETSSRKTYEVSDNSFVAVDVYESESSDMPDSIYAKGNAAKRKFVTNSDSSDMENINVFKPKKLKKRKYSGSAKEMSDDSSSDLPGVDTSSDDDSADNNGDSYLVRGEALGKVRKSSKNRNKSRKKSLSGKSSDDEFIMKLTSIVNDGAGSDVDEADEHDPETSTEVVDARHIVETVLERRTKRSKSNASAKSRENKGITAHIADKEPEGEAAVVSVETPEKKIDEAVNSDKSKESEKEMECVTVQNHWAITDEIGVTDDLPPAPLLENSTDNSSGSPQDIPSNDSSREISMLETPTTSKSAQKQTHVLATIPAHASKNNKAKTRTANAKPLDAEAGWNEEMKRFYNDSWGGEKFSVRNIYAKMPSKYTQ